MILLQTIPDLRRHLEERRRQLPAGAVVGLVPTMGALHAGHVSLIHAARKDCDCVVVSIFVNPTQFGPAEDYHAYPRTPQADCEVCERNGVDVIFQPDPHEIYPVPPRTQVHVAGLTAGLCGRSRPGHFDGVCLVVCKLFNIVQPQRAYFGQKDAQQATVIRRMAADLDFPIDIVVCPTVREPDGLALSSRNAYLTAEQRRQASALYQALQAMQQAVREGLRRAPEITARGRAIIQASGPAAIDYLELVDPESLEPVESVDQPVLAALAVRLGRCRLIDNMPIEPLPVPCWTATPETR